VAAELQVEGWCFQPLKKRVGTRHTSEAEDYGASPVSKETKLMKV
jgi:hypothetical protein